MCQVPESHVLYIAPHSVRAWRRMGALRKDTKGFVQLLGPGLTTILSQIMTQLSRSNLAVWHVSLAGTQGSSHDC